MYRVTRTTLRGQWENDQCFALWLKNTPTVHYVTLIDDPTNTGGPNDRRFYVWEQTAILQPDAMPKCKSDPDLMTEAGANGWNTAGEAAGVISRIIKKNVTIDEMVKAANEKAISLENIAAGVAKDIGKDVDSAVKSFWTSPLTWTVGALAVGAAVLWKVFKS